MITSNIDFGNIAITSSSVRISANLLYKGFFANSLKPSTMDDGRQSVTGMLLAMTNWILVLPRGSMNFASSRLALVMPHDFPTAMPSIFIPNGILFFLGLPSGYPWPGINWRLFYRRLGHGVL